jgi:hypothetical protein
MLKRIAVALFLALFAVPAFAIVDYSDMWYIPAESGWGANFTQNANILFVTFFIYDQNGKPIWYVAILGRNADGSFSGTLYSTVGTYFGAPWNPAAYAPTAAGTASFTPLNAYQGTLSFAVTGGPTVNKQVVRQTLTTINLTGNFTGAQAGGYSNCMNASDNGPYKDTFDLQVTQSAGNVTMTFAYAGLGFSCTFSGALIQNGQLYTVPSATYTCEDGINTTANMSEIKLTSQGIEGRFTSPSVGGCREDAVFSGVNVQ